MPHPELESGTDPDALDRETQADRAAAKQPHPLGCILTFFWTLLTLPIWLCGALLTAIATTEEGRLCGLAVLFFVPAPVLILNRRRWSRVALGTLFLVASLSILVVVALRSPNSGHAEGPNAQLHYLNGTSHTRYSPANLVPEVDQHILGTYLVPFVDGTLGFGQTRRLRATIKDLYAEIRADPDLADLPSTLGFAYDELLFGRRPHGNLFVYIPPGGTEPKPVLLFLHGSLGNFQGYWMIWKKFADAQGYAIVAPTFGSGNWQESGGLQAIEFAKDFCAKHERLDAARLVLAGVSNGGMGVTRAAAEWPDHWRALVLISPVLEERIVTDDDFLNAWQGRPVLLITGEEDRRVSADQLRPLVERLSAAELALEARFLTGKDHFLLFADWSDLCTTIGTWLEASLPRTPNAPD